MFAEIIPVKRGPLKLPFFDYAIPGELQNSLQVGQLVTVPMRGSTIFGIVKKIKSSTEVKKPALIADIVHPTPLLSAPQMQFCEEISNFYFTSLGSIVKTSLLPLQKRKLKKLSTPNHTVKKENFFNKPELICYANDKEKAEFIASVVALPGQHLIIAPEVTDTLTLQKLLPETVLAESCCLSSYTSEKELFALWESIWNGEKRIIIGTRRALFLSFHNLRSIVVDNEGSFAHKSWDSAPRFHAREAALMLGKHLGAAVYLSGHRPSVETYYYAKNNVYALQSKELLPEIMRTFELASLASERRGGKVGALSSSLQDAITNHPTGSIFLCCHRRGTGGYLLCRDCKKIAKCPRCTKTLTYYSETNELRCHSCNHREPVRETCPSCHSVSFVLGSPGSSAVANEVKKLFPNDKREVIEITSEVNFDKLADLAQSDKIIIGTIAAWSAVPWNTLSVLAFIDADAPLFVPEFRMAEEIWQMMNDARYRVRETTEVIIQTNHKDHPVFKLLTSPAAWYDNELAERKVFNYPPFTYLIKLFYKHQNANEAASEAKRLYQTLTSLTNGKNLFTISAPQSFFPPFYRGFYWQGLILRLPLKEYKQTLKLIAPHLRETWKVDPNPSTLLSI